MIEFRVLGELAVRRGHDPVPIPTSMLQRLLALLVCQVGQPVHVDYLADALWDGDPPRTARKTLQVYIHRLRRALGDDARVVHSAAGYLLVAAAEEVDSRVFERLTAQAVDARSRGDLPMAAELLEQALGQWRGAAYAGMRDIATLAAEAERLEENRLAALEERIAIGLELGRHAELIGDLTVAIREHPYRERFHAQLMLALYRNGQQANALEAYRQTRNRLVTELGVEPIPELQRLHQQILANDPALAAATPLVTLTQASRRFLPQDVPDFTGRRGDLEMLSATAGGSAKTVVISAVTGMAGIGKTALAVHWGHQIAAQFPDGQLYVNLRGYDPGQPLRPIDGLIHLLRCLGVAPERIPVELDDAAALYRSLLASKKILILLDNARTADQVRSLLPGEPGCFTVVTSRDRLSGLIAIDGAKRLTLGVLPAEDAIHLLRQLIGTSRVDAEPAETAELVQLCANLPLALRIAAAHLTDRPEQSIGQYTTDLRLGDRVEALSIVEDEHHAVGAVLSQSVSTLPLQMQSAFRFLAVIPGPDFTAAQVAALLDVTVERAEATLETLVAAHLLEQSSPGRYSFHDLIREFASAILRSSGDSAQEAQRRLFDHLNHVAALANSAISSGPSGALSAEDALTWLAIERANLVAAMSHAAASGLPELACDIAKSLWHSFHYTGHTGDWIATFEIAAAAVSQTNDLSSKYFLLNALGQGYSRAGQYDRALEIHRECLQGRMKLGDEVGVARSRSNIAISYERQGRYQEALAELEPALETFHAHGELLVEAGTRATALVSILLRMEEYEKAKANATQALAVLREIATPFDTVRTLFGLGKITLLLGEPDVALGHATEANELAVKLGDRTSEALTLDLLASVCHALTDYPASIQVRLRANEMYEEQGVRGGVCEGLNDLGRTYSACGQPELARSAHEQALAIADSLGNRHQRARALAGIGVLMREADPVTARSHLTQALEILEPISASEAADVRNELDTLA